MESSASDNLIEPIFLFILHSLLAKNDRKRHLNVYFINFELHLISNAINTQTDNLFLFLAVHFALIK